MRRGFDSLYPHHEEEHHTLHGVFLFFIMYDRKLVIVQNPYSTRHSEVQAGVFDRLDVAGIAYDTITTRFSRAEDNIRDLADRLPDGTHIISAAGDGTSTQVVNAGLRAELDDAVYSFIGYGNCNDLARGQRDPLPLLQTNRHTIIHQPLAIEVNGEPWRYAPGYMTLGLTALIASGFAGAASRERMRRTPPHTKLVRSMGQVATTYLRAHDTYLPPFTTNFSAEEQAGLTDVMIINNQRMGRVIRSSIDYPQTDFFGYHQANFSSICKNIPFACSAIAGHTPAEKITDITLNFREPATILAQTEGEHATLPTVSTIHVYKDPAKAIQVVRL
jgi:hypothetical protein